MSAPTRRPLAQRVPIDEPFTVEESQDVPRYVKGERVRHRKFGSGIVQDVSGIGRNLKVMVQFDDTDVGTKHLLVAFAGLERDWEGDAP